MHANLRLSVVIPCYNEEDGVREVIGRMPKAVDEIVVVDNNCTDRTAEVARSLGAVVVVPDAGHTHTEPGILHKLVTATERFR